MCGGVHGVITGNKFHQNRLRGFRATGVQKSGTPIDLSCCPYNSSALPCWLWFHQNRSRGFRATGVWKSGSPIDLACRPYNSSALPCWLWLRKLLDLKRNPVVHHKLHIKTRTKFAVKASGIVVGCGLTKTCRKLLEHPVEFCCPHHHQ